MSSGLSVGLASKGERVVRARFRSWACAQISSPLSGLIPKDSNPLPTLGRPELPITEGPWRPTVTLLLGGGRSCGVALCPGRFGSLVYFSSVSIVDLVDKSYLGSAGQPALPE